MIQILISYFVILYIVVGFGSITHKLMRLGDYGLQFQVLIGFFNLLIYTTVFASFGGLSFVYFLSIFAISTLAIVFNFSFIKKIFTTEIESFKQISFISKGMFLLLILVTLIYSSSLPILADNESYYIQTIKWLNEYGLVKGVANIHPFLGQTSGWHILQAGLNFKFLVPNLNDLNGFLIIISCFFSLKKWEEFKRDKNENDMFISLILFTLPLLFFFIDSPSPDLPILIITPLIAYLFIDSFKGENHIKIITILSLLAILIKVTVAPILILLVILLIRENKLKTYYFPFILSVVSLACFVLKNMIITGYPLYPLSIGNELFDVDWKMNANLQTEYYQLTKMFAWKLSNWEEFNQIGFWDKFKIWINLPRMNGLMNKLIILSMVVFPILNRKRKEMMWLYLFFLVQFVVFYATSPQYRFFLPVLVLITLLIAIKLFNKREKIVTGIIGLNIIILLFVGVFGLGFGALSNNKIMTNIKGITTSQIIKPRSITQFEDIEYKKYKIGNLEYYSPENVSFFWQTSDGPLPCVNKKMIDYFSERHNHIPQKRTDNIKNGFFSAKAK